MNSIQPLMFEALFNQLAMPVSVIKADAPIFTIVAFNNQYKKRSQVPEGEMIGRPAFEVYQPWDEASAEQFRLLKQGLYQAIEEKQQVNLPILTFDSPATAGSASERTFWQIQITPVLGSNEVVDYLMCITQNVTTQESIRLSVEEAKLIEEQQHEELQSLNEELAATNEELTVTVEELRQSQESLYQLNHDLEARIAQRTAALAASEEYYKSVLNALPQIAWTSTAAGEISFFNQRWYDYTGLDEQQSKLSGFETVVHPDDLQRSIDAYQAIVASGKPGEFEIREKGADDKYRWHLVRVQPIFNLSGHIEHWIGTATDIDALKQLQQQKDDFISIASHELKTPITSLNASLQLMDKIKNNPSGELLPKLIMQSRKSMLRVSTLIDDLLNVSRFQQGGLRLNKANFILSQLLNSCCNPISIMGKHKFNITGDIELEVNADEHRIDQVIVNFVNNAVKYAPESEFITLEIKKEGGMAKVSVIDKGPGIPKDKIPHLFDRFYRVDSLGHHASGLGLGLYISAEIIKWHNGEIGVESELGQGTTFWFTLPLD